MEDELTAILVSEAVQDVYLEAINSCLKGDLRAADRNLAALGCNWRLSSAVWAAAANTHKQQQQQQQQELSPRPSPCLVHDGLLPPAVLAALQAAFHARDSDFWQQHRNGEDTTLFFSYLIELERTAAAATAAAEGGSAPPRHRAAPPCALELAALMIQQHLCQQLAAQQPGNTSLAAVATAVAQASHVEWWVHTRPPWAPHQLHFDSAEGTACGRPVADGSFDDGKSN